MKIYTKTGDNGKTSLCDGSRLPKDDMRIEAYGTLDELNANIGLLIAMLQSDTPKESPAHDNKLTERLEEIQAELFVIGTELAYTECKVKTIVTTKEMIKKIEGDIDLMASQLPTHHHFILPGGTLSAAQSQRLPHSLSPCRASDCHSFPDDKISGRNLRVCQQIIRLPLHFVTIFEQ